jgi:hypothetical protein
LNEIWSCLIFIKLYILHFFFSTSSNCTSCGRTNLSERIVGGNETKIHEFPWHVGVIKSNQIGLRPFCGGTLISEKFDSSSYFLTFLLSQKSLSCVHGSSSIWTCRISNICCCYLKYFRQAQLKNKHLKFKIQPLQIDELPRTLCNR